MIIPTVRKFPGLIIFSNPLTPFNPSTADATEIGGVIIPSANKVPAPIMAGRYNQYAGTVANFKINRKQEYALSRKDCGQLYLER